MAARKKRGSGRRGPGPEGELLRSFRREAASPVPGRQDEEQAEGACFFAEVAPGRAVLEAKAYLRRSLGGAFEISRAHRAAESSPAWLLARSRAFAARESPKSVWDVAHALREGSGGLLRHVEPDWPQAPSADEQPCGRKGSTWCFDEMKGPANRRWHLEAIDAPRAWKKLSAPPGAGTSIAHLDTGYTDHPENAGLWDVAGGWNFIEGEDPRDPRDPLPKRGSPGHGTKTASVIAARPAPRPSKKTGLLTGVAPGATIVPIRVIRRVVIFFNRNVADGIRHAIEADCHVISMSLGGVAGGYLETMVQDAVERDIIVCAAAGNCWGSVVEPASFEECIAVAATNPDGRRWKGSATGRDVDVSAPGGQVWVAGWCEDTRRFMVNPAQGTSYAVACVAGLAALWLSHHGRDALIARYGAHGVRLQWVFRKLLRETAAPHAPPREDGMGTGIANALNLIEATLPDPKSVRQFRDAKLRTAALDAGRRHARVLGLAPEDGGLVSPLASALGLSRTPPAERKLLELELRQILHDHPNARRALVAESRARLAAARPMTKKDLRQPFGGIVKYASDRLRAHLE